MAPSVKSRQESVKLLRLPTKFEISVDDMSVFSWSLLNRTKNFSGGGKMVALRATIPTYFFLSSDQNIWRGHIHLPPPSYVMALASGTEYA